MQKLIKHNSHQCKAFSLVELVIVIVIIGVLAAIAIPRFSKAASGANASAVSGDLAVLRNAIELYAAEHGGTYPTLANFEAALTGYTLLDGSTTTAGTEGALGPYLQSIPKVKVGSNAERVATLNTYTETTAPATASGDGGWYYNATTGQIWCNVTGYLDK